MTALGYFQPSSENVLKILNDLVATVDKALAGGDEDVLNCVAPLLVGLAKSDATTEYEGLISDFIDSGSHLAEIARQYRFNEGVTPEKVVAVVKSAVAHDDQITVIECLVFAIVTWKRLGDDVIGKIFEPALDYLTKKKDSCAGARALKTVAGGRAIVAHHEG